MKTRHTLRAAIVVATASLTLAGCQEEDEVVQEDDLVDTLIHANNPHEDWSDIDGWQLLSRWDLDPSCGDTSRCGLIAIDTADNQHVWQALDAIEASMGMAMFVRDDPSYAPEDLGRGMVVSEGTANHTWTHIDGCGEVSDDQYDSDGRMNGVTIVRLGNESCPSPSYGVVLHEFGHALGLYNHVEGFGYGAAIGSNAWNLLYTLYHNPVGASRDEIQPIRIR